MLKLNESKTELLLISSVKNKSASKAAVPSINIGGSEIFPNDSIRNLGVQFDATMSMDKQVSNVCKLANHQIRKISRKRRMLDRKTAVMLVHAFVTSRLDYCNALLYGLPQNLTGKVQRVLHIAARVVTGTPLREHITPVLKGLHWLPITQRSIYKILPITYKALHGMAPSYICELIKPRQRRGMSMRSDEAIVLCVPPNPRLPSYGDRAFYIAAPVLWNVLPISIRQART